MYDLVDSISSELRIKRFSKIMSQDNVEKCVFVKGNQLNTANNNP